MRRLMLLAPIAAAALLAACNNTGTAASPSDVQQTVGQAVCDAQAQILDLVGQVQVGSIQSKADAVSRLQQLQTKLESEADRLESSGQGSVATQVRNVADGVGQLAAAVNGADPGAVVSGATRVADAIRQVPGCPSSSP